MNFSVPNLTLSGIFIILSVINAAGKILRRRFPFDSYLKYTWVFFLGFTLSELVSFPAGLWILALMSFLALREYFSLVDIRFQDRLGILGAYLSIPFMIYFIQIDWYGMFIISIPVYAFLAIPLGSGDFHFFAIRDIGLFKLLFQMKHAFDSSITEEPKRWGFEAFRIKKQLTISPYDENFFPVNIDGSTMMCRLNARFEIVARIHFLGNVTSDE